MLARCSRRAPARRLLSTLSLAAALSTAILVGGAPAYAASSKGCEGGGFAITELVGANAVSGEVKTSIPAANLGPTFLVTGLYVEFRVVSASFGVQNWTRKRPPALRSVSAIGGFPPS